MKIDPNAPAYPVVLTRGVPYTGMTVRAHIAATIAAGYRANPNFGPHDAEAIASYALHDADALIDALNGKRVE